MPDAPDQSLGDENTLDGGPQEQDAPSLGDEATLMGGGSDSTHSLGGRGW